MLPNWYLAKLVAIRIDESQPMGVLREGHATVTLNIRFAGPGRIGPLADRVGASVVLVPDPEKFLALRGESSRMDEQEQAVSAAEADPS